MRALTRRRRRQGLLRGAAVGYALNTGFHLAVSLFSRKFFASPVAALRRAGGRDSLRFGLFLGAMGFAYRLLQCLFCKIRGRPTRGGAAAAAAIAGTAILLDAPERRSTVSVYLFVRAAYELLRAGVASGALPDVPHLATLVFAACQAPIMYAFLREPHALSPAYHKWILRMADMRGELVEALTGLHCEFAPCSRIWHPGQSCAGYNLRDFARAFALRAVPIYVPVHVLPPLLFKRRHVLAHPLAFARETVVAIARSALFLSAYTAIVKSSMCFWRRALGRNSSLACCAAGVATGAALLIEHPRRHIELTLYVVPRALEALSNLSAARHPRWLAWLRDSGAGDALLFSAALAAFVYRASGQPKLKAINAAIFRLCFGSGTLLAPSESAARLAPQRVDSDGDGDGDGERGPQQRKP
jgi:hypothetical protein